MMRRKDREVRDILEIERIIRECRICHVAMIWRGEPYVVPLNFGYDLQNGVLNLYFHSAVEGKKMEAFREHGRVCFEMVCGERLVPGNQPWECTYHYKSVIGSGLVKFLEETEEKRRALSLLFLQQTGQEVLLSEQEMRGVCLYQIISNDFCGKRNGD